MSIRNNLYRVLRLGVVVSMTVACIGCGGNEDDPTAPEPEVGTIIVDPSPDTIGALWALTGPNDYSKSDSGDQTLSGLVVGDYTVTWGEAPGWITPSELTQTLAAEETLVFNGAYIEEGEDTGTIVIDQTPDELTGAGWTLVGPQSASGSGDQTLTDMPAGEYELTWIAVGGYSTPFGAPQTLAADGTITFSGTYSEETGTIEIQQTPDILAGAGWTLTGPQGSSGSGDQTLTDMPIGEYELSWNTVDGYSTPVSPPQVLGADGTIFFTGAYSDGTGTIVIDQTPDMLAGAGWTLSGPQGGTGTGDEVLGDMFVGEYTIVWADVSGYLTPEGDMQTLEAAGTITFHGTYIDTGEFVTIPDGVFTMGSPDTELGHESNETAHQVTLTTPFEMFSTEVTNRQYADLAQWACDNGYCTATSTSLRDALDGSTQELLDLDDEDCEISFSGGAFTVDEGKEDHPVLEVTWYGAVAYCDWLSLQAGLPRAYNHSTWQCNGHEPYASPGYRLPTEAEWEYACRAGSETAFANGQITHEYCADPVLDVIGWYCGNANFWTHPVGQLSPNSWGLYDMHGNLREWCNDWYGGYGGDATDPKGPDFGSRRVVRDGYFNSRAPYCRSACRYYFGPDYSYNSCGFRPVRSTN